MRKVVAAAIVCCILLGSLSAFAIEPERMISEAVYCTAKLFYCDAKNNNIVITDVKPINPDALGAKEIADMAEYTEIPIVCKARFSDGVTISGSELNRYADSDIGVIITRSPMGICIVGLKFL